MSLTRPEFERMALEHIDLLYRIARRLAGNDSAAEDLVQETYVRAIRSWETFRLESYGIRPWLIRILHNLFFSNTRRENRHPTALEQEHLDAVPDTAVDSTAPPLSPLSFEAMDERLVRALNRLPADYQVIILLFAVEELSYKEIADSLDIPIGTVMSRLHRAKQKLAEQLTDYAKDHRILRE
jgi:RNA polymerase sigma-70 factor (ECF subfamily)